MRRWNFTYILIAVLGCMIFGVTAGMAASTKPFLHPLFSNNMVLQRDIPVPVWGWAGPGTKITVSMLGKSAGAIAGTDGKWMARIGPFKAGGPYTLSVTCPDKKVTINVLVGDVWLCSGQSNMEMGVSGVNNAQTEIAQANYPRISIFQVENRLSTVPQNIATGSWQVCSPETMRQFNFTAAGYFFARKLHNDLNIPIGLIQSDWSGTVAEAWTSADALAKMPDFTSSLNFLAAWNRQYNIKSGDNRPDYWWDEVDPVSINNLGWEKPEYDISGWSKVNQPRYWDTPDLAYFDGIVWMRKDVDIPAELAGKSAVLDFGAIDDNDTTYVNGIRIGDTTGCTVYRKYTVPAGILKAGKNSIVVRVIDTAGGGGFYNGDNTTIRLVIGDTSISLNGEWNYKVDAPIGPNVVSVLYNGMIAPLIPYGIKGAIWYQGESNSDRALQYRTLLPAMISDWRSKFGVGDFPFMIVQLANFMQAVPDPVQPGWAELREAQLLTSQKTPNCGLAVITDIGDPDNVHPMNKQDVGYRLAVAAEGIAYHKKIEYSGPVYVTKRIERSAVRLYFKHTGEGLVARDGVLKGFAIAGTDKKWVWADAKIDGKTIVVSSPSVDKPVAVRYNWANCPYGNLYNSAGLPASCFRTDIN